MDADHDKQGQRDVPPQTEEDPDTSDDAVLSVDVLEVVNPPLFPIEPDVHPGQSEFGEEHN